MSTFTLRNIPPTLMKTLKNRAKEQRRSINSQIIFDLEIQLQKDIKALENKHFNAMQEQSGAFDFLNNTAEDIYTVNDIIETYK